MKYKIVEAATVQQLEWHVHLWIAKGWVPMGGVAVAPGQNPLKQAMVKRDEPGASPPAAPPAGSAQVPTPAHGKRKPKLIGPEIVGEIVD
jgi:hypothetical protein